MQGYDLIYFLTGKDEFRKDIFINKLKAKLSLTQESADCNIYYGKDQQAADIIAALKTPPLLANVRLVILKEANQLPDEDKDKLISYFKRPAESSIFAVATTVSLNSSDRLNTAAKRYAKCLDFPVAAESETASVFKLIDEIGLKEKKMALQTLFSIMQTKKDAHEILGLIAWHIRRLGKVKILVKRGKVKEEIAQALRVSYYTAGNIINQAKGISLGEIKRAQQLLIETDTRLKKSVQNPRLLLEMLIMRLTSNL